MAVLLLAAGVAQARDCESRERFNAAQEEIDQSLAVLRSGRALPKLEAKLTALGWSKERRAESLKAVFSSDTMAALHKEESAYVYRLHDAVMSSSGPSPQMSKCEAAKQVKALAGKIWAVNQRQYDHAARALGLTAAPAK